MKTLKKMAVMSALIFIFTACNQQQLEPTLPKSKGMQKNIAYNPYEYNCDFDMFSKAISMAINDNPVFKELLAAKFESQGNNKSLLISDLIQYAEIYGLDTELNNYMTFSLEELLEKYPYIKISRIKEISLWTSGELEAAVVFKSYEYYETGGLPLDGYIYGDTPYQAANAGDNEFFLLVVSETNADMAVQIEYKTVNRPFRQMVLGDVIPNPFSVENMQQAKELMYEYAEELEALAIPIDFIDNFNISTTDYYVRFLPQNNAQYDILENDGNLILFPYPLHRKILEEGDYYIDEDLLQNENLIWQYAVVPVNYSFNNEIEYEILEELFLPEHSSQLANAAEYLNSPDPVIFESETETILETDFMHALTAAAFRAAGYEEDDRTNNHNVNETECVQKKFLFIKWTDCDTKIYPQGRISIQTPAGTTGLSGVQIKIHRWYRADKVYTDGAGYFYDSQAWSASALADYYIGYDVIMNGKRQNNEWNFRTNSFVFTHSHNLGYSRYDNTFDATVTTGADATWGRCVLSNALYDFCLNAQNTSMTLPPNHLRIVSGKSDELTPISTPLLNQGVYLSALVFNNVDALAYSLLLSFYLQMGTDLIRFLDIEPDMLMKFNDNLSSYNEMATNMWHELSHSSHFNCIKNNHSNQAALDYWDAVVALEMGQTIFIGGAYGTKGGYIGWEQIALTEGWAKFREWYLGKRYLNYNILLELKDSDGIPLTTNHNAKFTDFPWTDKWFNYEYAGMFQELYNASCSMQNLEKSLSASTINGYKTTLLSFEPASRHSAINTIIANYLP